MISQHTHLTLQVLDYVCQTKEVKSKGKKRYLPEAAWSALSKGEKAATNKAKAAGTKKGKQFVSQPKSIKEKTKKYR